MTPDCKITLATAGTLPVRYTRALWSLWSWPLRRPKHARKHTTLQHKRRTSPNLVASRKGLAPAGHRSAAGPGSRPSGLVRARRADFCVCPRPKDLFAARQVGEGLTKKLLSLSPKLRSEAHHKLRRSAPARRGGWRDGKSTRMSRPWQKGPAGARPCGEGCCCQRCSEPGAITQ
jgi:hypothetical protein